MSQAMLTNILCVSGWVGVAVLQHFGLIDPTTSTVIYAAIGVMGGYKNGVNNGVPQTTSTVNPGTPTVSQPVSQAVSPTSERG